MNDLVRILHGPVIMSIYSSEQVGEIALRLEAIEDWLREKCGPSMADPVKQAIGVLEDLHDELLDAEQRS